MQLFPVWRYRKEGGGIIVHSEAEDAQARERGFIPADEIDSPQDEEADPIPDVETEEPKPRRRRRAG